MTITIIVVLTCQDKHSSMLGNDNTPSLVTDYWIGGVGGSGVG